MSEWECEWEVCDEGVSGSVCDEGVSGSVCDEWGVCDVRVTVCEEF